MILAGGNIVLNPLPCFKKETNILDVWFDSGVSHAAVLEQRPNLGSPADMYLEGNDQHRGWFHSSLLESVGTRPRAPYRNVLTHGFVVDGEGKKMSKSVGNVIDSQTIIDEYGEDSPQAAESKSVLGACLVALGRVDEARSLLDAALRTLEAALGPDHRGGEGDVARLIKIPPFVAQKISLQARRFSRENLDSIYHRLLIVDQAVKSGKGELEVELDVLAAELTH